MDIQSTCERCGSAFPYRLHYCGEIGVEHTDAQKVAEALKLTRTDEDRKFFDEHFQVIRVPMPGQDA